MTVTAGIQAIKVKDDNDVAKEHPARLVSDGVTLSNMKSPGVVPSGRNTGAKSEIDLSLREYFLSIAIVRI